MYIHLKKLLILTLVFFGFATAAHQADAAQVFYVVEPSIPSASTPFTLQVKVATDGEAINAVEGFLVLPADLMVEHISTGGSSFTLWPNAPHFVPSTHHIEFTGGTPGGLDVHQVADLFTITLRANTPGNYQVSVKNLVAYLNDGKGTPVTILMSPQKISVGEKNNAVSIATEDTTPPQFVSVEIGNDQSLFGNRAYVTFFATDDLSGVASYQVKEGVFGKYTSADRYYVFHDQTMHTGVWVKSIDAAGNTKTYTVISPQVSILVWLVGGAFLILGALFFLRRLRKRNTYE